LAARHREVDTVLAGRTPTLADLPNLPYTLMVIKETMRLQPIVSALPRAILKDTELGGYQLSGQSLVFTSPYVLHRDPRWWDEPEQFSPSRFSPENEAKIHKYAYMPFGAGPRICIGNHFALMEAQILLSMMVSRYTLHLEPGQMVEAQRQITTSPKGGLSMRLARR
jgi:cytochrome P450